MNLNREKKGERGRKTDKETERELLAEAVNPKCGGEREVKL